MGLMRSLRRVIQHAGIDINRFPVHDPMYYVVLQLHAHGITCVLDVGANGGDYARALRRFGYLGRIVSFEPVREPFERAQRAARRDPAWIVFRYALGSERGEATINVAGNAGHSSSMLPMLNAHRQAAPSARCVGSENVEQRTLDGLWDVVVLPEDVVCLKVDVQGYERQVLDGARCAFAAGRIRALQMEMSLVPLFEGGWLYDEALAWATAEGFSLARLIPGFTDRSTGGMLQADALLFADSDPPKQGA